MSQPLKVWVNEVVYLRGLGILSVLFLHTSTKLKSLMEGAPAPWPVDLVASLLTGIPAFIFASGFVMGLSSKGPHRDWAHFLKRRALAILPPYIFFSVVYFLYFSAASKPPGEWPLRMIAGIVRGNTAAHMWFVVAIFQLYLLLPILEKLHDAARQRNMLPHLLAASALIQLTWTIGFPPAIVALSQGAITESDARQICWRFFPFSLFLFVAGLTAAKNREAFLRLFRYAPLAGLIGLHLAVGFFLAYLENETVMRGARALLRFVLRFTALGIYFQWSLKLAESRSLLSRWVGSYGQYAYGVYLAHVLVQDLLYAALRGAGAAPADLAGWIPALFLATATITLILVRVIARIPGSAYLIGQTEGRSAKKALPSTNS